MPTANYQQQQVLEQPTRSDNRKININSLRKKSMKRHSSSSSCSSSSCWSNNNNKFKSIMSKQEQQVSLDSNCDYDEIRNKTLMFFLDRLFLDSKEGKSVRSLHDLSCLFGTKEFTKEMRQIVGASRNGLRKFLESYPSLFTIEGDKVYWTQFKQDTSGNGNKLRARDYTKEAVEYFSNKLKQFGASKVPIRYLFGYRSQASQEVRHVSGRNSKEFNLFLMSHSNVFKLIDQENVMLKDTIIINDNENENENGDDNKQELNNIEDINNHMSMSSSSEITGENIINDNESSSSLSLSQKNPTQSKAVIDPYLNKRLAQSLEESIRNILSNKINEDRVKIEDLFYIMESDKENNKLFSKMINDIQDLRMLIRMHPKIFKRLMSGNNDHEEDNKSLSKQFDCVRLLNEEERKEFELHMTPSSSQYQQQQQQQQQRQQQQQESKSISDDDQSVNGSSPLSLPVDIEAHKSQDNDNDDDSGTRSKRNSIIGKDRLAKWADAPPFIPASLQQLERKENPYNAKNRLTKKSYSNLVAGKAGIEYNNNQEVKGGQQLISADARKSLRSYLIKASASNKANYSSNKLANGALEMAPKSMDQSQQQQQVTSKTNNKIISNNNKTDIMSNTKSLDDSRARMVNMVREASNIVTQIQGSTDAIAFDCKGYNLGLNGQITLIQFAYLLENSLKPEIAIFDLITNPELAFCLKPLLESDNIVKVVHDARNKSNALHKQFNIILKNVFDTQVANLVIQQQETGKPAYKSRYISISKLCEIYGDESLNKYRNLIRSKTRHANLNQSNNNIISVSNSKADANYWKIRPLTESMIYESTMDVYCIIGGIYQKLKSIIQKEYEPLLNQLNLECILARIKPDEIRGLKKERKTELEVLDLRRKLFTPINDKIVLSNRELRLLRHIELTDEVRKKIQHCPKVAKKLERLDMKRAKLNQADSGDVISGTNNDLICSINDDSDNQDQNSQQSSVCDLSAHAHDDDDDDDDELTKTDALSSLMNELKDRMFETSSLLESLDDDDEDPSMVINRQSSVTGALASIKSHTHEANHECCRCNCHKSSASSSEKSNNSIISNVSINDNSNVKSGSESGKESTTDTAIQCDLLS